MPPLVYHLGQPEGLGGEGELLAVLVGLISCDTAFFFSLACPLFLPAENSVKDLMQPGMTFTIGEFCWVQQESIV
jgi:hypothetical protein